MNECSSEWSDLEEVLPILVELVAQRGKDYFFSMTPLQLEERVAELGPTVFMEKQERGFAFLAGMGIDVDKCRERGMASVRNDTRMLCEIIGNMTQSQCQTLLEEAEGRMPFGAGII